MVLRMRFKNRIEAGKLLAEKLETFKNSDAVILALPRGGVPVALPISHQLNLPLDILVVRKIGAPNQKEYGLGAIAEGNVLVLDKKALKELHLSENDLKETIALEKEELQRRIDMYRKGKQMIRIIGKTVILVDDGLATGVSAKAAIKAVKQKKAKEIIFATPVSSKDAHKIIGTNVLSIICLYEPLEFLAVGNFYENFEEVSDEEVMNLLENRQLQ